MYSWHCYLGLGRDPTAGVLNRPTVGASVHANRLVPYSKHGHTALYLKCPQYDVGNHLGLYDPGCLFWFGECKYVFLGECYEYVRGSFQKSGALSGTPNGRALTRRTPKKDLPLQPVLEAGLLSAMVYLHPKVYSMAF